MDDSYYKSRDQKHCCHSAQNETAQFVPCDQISLLYPLLFGVMLSDCMILHSAHKTQSCRIVVNRIVNSDYFMVVTFKVVHVVRLDNQKVVTMTIPDYPKLRPKRRCHRYNPDHPKVVNRWQFDDNSNDNLSFCMCGYTHYSLIKLKDTAWLPCKTC